MNIFTNTINNNAENVIQTLKTTPDLAGFLEKAGGKIYLYGTGDGSDKIIALLEELELKFEGIFVSDDFFRGQSFHSVPVRPLCETETLCAEDVLLVCFGSHLQEMRAVIEHLMNKPFTTLIPDVPVCLEDGPILNQILTAHTLELYEAEIIRAYNALDDDESKKLFLSTLVYKYTADPHYLFMNETQEKDAMPLLKLGPNEHYLDAGAYRGDSVKAFAELVFSFSSITALEPDLKSFEKLTSEYPDINAVNAALGGLDRTVTFRKSKGRGSNVGARSALKSSSSGKETTVRLTTVNTLAKELNIPFTYIKLDIEGNEAEAISGSAEDFKNARALKIAAYHRSFDFFTLLNLLKGICPDKKMHIRKAPCFPCWELDIYALRD